MLTALMAPVRAFRIAYLPLLMVYFASGALGLTAVADTFFVKKSLTLTPADLAGLAVWLQLPWSGKMIVSALVNSVPFLGSQRRSYVFVGASMIAAGLVMLAGAAAGWLHFASLEVIYVIAQLLIVIGSVVQEVVADAMSAEVVAHYQPDGKPRPQNEIDVELAMVQVLARFAYTIGAFVVAWQSGVVAEKYSYATVFLLGLLIPAISVSGALIVRLEGGLPAPLDRKTLGGGIAFALVAVLLGASEVPLSQELLFVVSLGVIVYLLRYVMADLDPIIRQRFFAVAVCAFAFRAPPTLGEGYRWFTMDTLGFDERFFGMLQLTGTGVGMAVMWFLTNAATRQSARKLLLWLTFIAAILWLPSLLIVNGAHIWTQEHLGFGARSIALVDEAAQSPLAMLADVPLLTLIAVIAPAHQRATWFALAASLMNLSLVASQLITKYLNVVFPVDRGFYEPLASLVMSVVAISLLLPLITIVLMGKRLK